MCVELCDGLGRLCHFQPKIEPGEARQEAVEGRYIEKRRLLVVACLTDALPLRIHIL